MRTEIILIDQDIVTGFGSAGSGCILPPEIDFKQHSLGVAEIFESGDDLDMLGWSEDAATEALDDEGYRDWEIEWEPEWKFCTPCDSWIDPMRKHALSLESKDLGAILRFATATQNEPCGRRRGVYDSIR